MSEAQEWFYTDASGVENGPVSIDELQQLGATGTIHAQTDVWTEGMEEWQPASQIEGVIPPSPEDPPSAPAQPAHQPQINLGAGSGMQLQSTIIARPMDKTKPETSANPYARVNQTKKSPTGKIIFAIITVVAIGTGIYFATLPGEPKLEDTPGYIEYSKANDLINKKKNVDILGNDAPALEISKVFAASIKTHVDPAIEESFPGLLGKEGEVRTFTMAKTEGDLKTESDLKTAVVIVQVLKFKMLSAKAQKSLADAVWLNAKSALANTLYNDPKTQLVVALRDSEKYSKVMIGHPVISDVKDVKDAKVTLGITETHSGDDIETKLYPFFARKK
tara:strand:- start:21 stop:1022 length:1002 start_codon:yes stop_codon:yes gene_type:complete